MLELETYFSRILTAFAWPSSFSAFANIFTVSARLAKPWGEAVWKDNVLPKSETDRPEYVFAYPAVGRVWFYPEA